MIKAHQILLKNAEGEESLKLLNNLTIFLNKFFLANSIKLDRITAESIVQKIFFDTKTYNEEKTAKNIKNIFLDHPKEIIPSAAYLPLIETISYIIHYCLIHHGSIEHLRLNPDHLRIREKLLVEMKSWDLLEELKKERKRILPK